MEFSDRWPGLGHPTSHNLPLNYLFFLSHSFPTCKTEICIIIFLKNGLRIKLDNVCEWFIINDEVIIKALTL